MACELLCVRNLMAGRFRFAEFDTLEGPIDLRVDDRSARRKDRENESTRRRPTQVRLAADSADLGDDDDVLELAAESELQPPSADVADSLAASRDDLDSDDESLHLAAETLEPSLGADTAAASA
ncbi:MAG: hypothetical protein U0992_21735 [Planctomycetaceae bacterium]